MLTMIDSMIDSMIYAITRSIFKGYLSFEPIKLDVSESRYIKNWAEDPCLQADKL